MAGDLPTEFDVIVLGTGMPESIIAGAFSRIGQRVLHLDKNEFYSSEWAGFNLQGLAKLSTDSDNALKHPDIDMASFLKEGERLLSLDLKPMIESSALSINFHIKHTEDSKLENCAKSLETSSHSSMAETVADLSNRLLEETLLADVTDDKENLAENQKIECDNVDFTNSCSNISESKSNDKATLDSEQESSSKFEDAEESNNLSEKVEQDDTNEESTVENPLSKFVWTPLKIEKEWRKFNLDLAPRLLFSAGSMVELLISSDVAKYCEFKTVTRVLTLINGGLKPVPCSRSDIFNSKDVSMAEKRVLMKFFTTCNKFDESGVSTDIDTSKPFIDFLKSQKLSDKILHYVLHAIAMSNPSDNTALGLARIKKFLRSLGRYGNTAFLWPLYGSGELPQSFCRLCAVFGGIYCLRMSASALILNDENSCTGIITTEGQRINTKWLIMNGNFAPPNYVQSDRTQEVSRAIFITNKSILEAESEDLSLLHLPCPDDENRPISVIELPASSMTCPQGLFVVHMTRITESGVSPNRNLAYAVDTLFSTDEQESGKASILWSAYFSLQDFSGLKKSDSVPNNVFLMSGPGSEIDLDCIVKEAEEIFRKILPEEEFLPRPPNPEDIIYVDNEETPVEDHSEHDDADGVAHFEQIDCDSKVSVEQAADNLICRDDLSKKTESTGEQTMGDFVCEIDNSEKGNNVKNPSTDNLV